jgi:isopentenyl-diphosphate delta-isomerase type 1
MRSKYPIVDDSDRIVGYKDKEQSYKEKAMLRSVQVFVYNSKGDIYVQKRSKKKLRYPNYFCASVAGHVEPGESYRQAATRELREELGLKEAKGLKFIAKEKTPIGKGNYAMMALFVITTDETITFRKEEIDSGNFYSTESIKQLIQEKNLFTPSFLHFFRKLHN